MTRPFRRAPAGRGSARRADVSGQRDEPLESGTGLCKGIVNEDPRGASGDIRRLERSLVGVLDLTLL